MGALRIYSKIERMTFKEIAELVGMNNNTITRYAAGDRLPDLDTLIHICNVLRISVGTFIHHPDVSVSSVQVFGEEEFAPIKFMRTRIEEFRKESKMEISTLLHKINDGSDSHISYATYRRLSEGNVVSMDLPMGFLNTFDVDLDFLFEDPQLVYLTGYVGNRNVMISSSYISNMRKRIRNLEDENRRLLTENRRLKTREQARYAGVDMDVHADREMHTFIRKVKRALVELEGYMDGSLTNDTNNDRE